MHSRPLSGDFMGNRKNVIHLVKQKLFLVVALLLVVMFESKDATAECTWDGTGCLTEQDIKPCEVLLADKLPREIERYKQGIKRSLDDGDQASVAAHQRGLDRLLNSLTPIVALALQDLPYDPLFDLKSTNYYIKFQKDRGYTEKSDLFLCMLYVRLSQLKASSPAKSRSPKPAADACAKIVIVNGKKLCEE